MTMNVSSSVVHVFFFSPLPPPPSSGGSCGLPIPGDGRLPLHSLKSSPHESEVGDGGSLPAASASLSRFHRLRTASSDRMGNRSAIRRHFVPKRSTADRMIKSSAAVHSRRSSEPLEPASRLSSCRSTAMALGRGKPPTEMISSPRGGGDWLAPTKRP
eukprot:scaffold16340_cov126-Isochrysis_galbana.AAC.3